MFLIIFFYFLCQHVELPTRIYCFAFVCAWTISQNRFVNCPQQWRVDAIRTSTLNATKSFVMSSATNMKSQQDPKTRFRNCGTTNAMHRFPAHWARIATKYPIGVLQLNGHLLRVKWKCFCYRFYKWLNSINGVNTNQIGKNKKNDVSPIS